MFTFSVEVNVCNLAHPTTLYAKEYISATTCMKPNFLALKSYAVRLNVWRFLKISVDLVLRAFEMNLGHIVNPVFNLRIVSVDRRVHVNFAEKNHHF
ncbi:hypothetical protein TNIN_334071 [Trichonephila inaurata madagascariensis]|uniref:Uncharacterized protein n=1 Tax=Trichonephila inaurata madagascariensis TaxID=2747483 RepID=A0A8X6XUG9_9ARAC|nr:hypothetical protein TNIN_334071 [Trichonephila inaurata madagascariensis]